MNDALVHTEQASISLLEAWKTATQLIRDSSDILLICHVSPDGDAIGSLLGLGLGLRGIGKTVALACESPIPAKFSFLAGYTSIVNTLDTYGFDLVIGLDSSDPSRLGSVYDVDRLGGVPLINIDHHITNLRFGDINVVDPQAASTAELVLTCLDHLGVSIQSDGSSDLAQNEGAATREKPPQSSEIATCLLTGMVTDTLGFRTSNVTPKVMAAAVRTMEAGASLSQVTYYAFNQRSLVELSLLASGLSRLQAEDGLAWSEITLADRHACGYAGDGDVGLVGMLARTKEIHIAAVFSEKDNQQVEISFRADPGFDVAQLALALGGGGHPAASGCTVDGSLESVKAQVLPLLRVTLDEQRRTNDSQQSSSTL
jgi:phosphoesterase RecJ-like protein